MVRSGPRGFRIGSSRSSAKKVGGPSVTVSVSAKKSGGSSSLRLPPIPHQETPSWQKPITNFFSKSNSPNKDDDSHNEDAESQISKKVRLNDEGEELNEIEVSNEVEITEES